jgi:hypothetical protein
MHNHRNSYGSPVFWAAPFAAVPNLPTGIDLDAHPQPLDLEPHDADVGAPAAEAAIGRVGRAVDVAAGAEVGEDGHRVEGSSGGPKWARDGGGNVTVGLAPIFGCHCPDPAPSLSECHRSGLCVMEGKPASLSEMMGPDGEWPEGLVGVALRVGSDLDAPFVGCTAYWRPWADVATQHHGVRRVRLRRPVERLALVWAWQIVGCADLEPETAERSE